MKKFSFNQDQNSASVDTDAIDEEESLETYRVKTYTDH